MAARALPEEQEGRGTSPEAAPNFRVHRIPDMHVAREGSPPSRPGVLSRELSLHWDGVSRQINVFVFKSRELITSAKSVLVNKLKLYPGNLK